MLRKLLNLPTKQQFIGLESDARVTLGLCNKIARIEIDHQQVLKEQYDSICPNVSCKSRDVYNRRFLIGDKPVNINHCKTCGREWEKYETIKISQTKVLRVALKYLRDILKNQSELNYGWKAETVEIFDGSYAETIYKLNKVKDKYMFPELTLRKLRKHYPSVYDRKSILDD